jgi:hypothetical protein
MLKSPRRRTWICPHSRATPHTGYTVCFRSWVCRPAQRKQLDDLVSLLIENLASGSVDRQTLSREGLAELLRRWISHSGTGVRIVRVFVACPKDAQDERAVLNQVVASINRTEGDAHQVRLDLRAAEFHPPQPGAAGGRGAADTPADGDLFLGIVSAAFDDRASEGLFRQAWDRWQTMGSPWIKFYFDDDPRVHHSKRAAYATVCDLREQLEPLAWSAATQASAAARRASRTKSPSTCAGRCTCWSPRRPAPRRGPIPPSTCGTCWTNPLGSTSAVCRSAPSGRTAFRSRTCTSR